jgi:crotonobetainyl-CoA:carnitine CoA-transferase CaiB-like acyl-CoA transferase
VQEQPRPLAGIHVLDFGMNIAGPQAASLLADLGAEVIKVEGPDGDSSRGFSPQADGISALFATMNRSKRYLGLDLTRPGARELLPPLLWWADVVVQNLRPGKAAQLGFSADECHAVNPRIVHADVEAFYPPELSRPGYDLLVQAETGMMSLTGSPDREPSRLPGSLLDHVTGLWVAFGVVSALHGERDRTRVRLSMSDIALHLLGERATTHLLSGEVPVRMGSSLGTTTALGAYPTADGDIVIGAANDRLFRRLAELVAPHLIDDPDYATQAARLAHRAKLDEHLSEGFARATSQAWLERLDTAGVPAGRIRDFPEAVARHRDMSRVGLVPVAGLSALQLVANPLGVHAGSAVDRPGGLGADSREIVTGLLGRDDAEYHRLVAEGIVVGA